MALARNCWHNMLRWSRTGRTRVSSCRYGICVLMTHPVATLSAEFCTLWSFTSWIELR